VGSGGASLLKAGRLPPIGTKEGEGWNRCLFQSAKGSAAEGGFWGMSKKGGVVRKEDVNCATEWGEGGGFSKYDSEMRGGSRVSVKLSEGGIDLRDLSPSRGG